MPLILCVGGSVLDRKYRAVGPLLPGTSNPVSSETAYGGVARNVAENLGRLGQSITLLSAVGTDAGGAALLEHTAGAGVDVSRVDAQGGCTAEYLAVLEPGGDLAFALADMALFARLDAAWLERHADAFAGASYVFADCNLMPAALEVLLELRRTHGFRLALDPVSVAKSARAGAVLPGLDLLFCNRDEATALVGAGTPEAQLERLRARGLGEVVLTLSAEGLVCWGASGIHRLSAPETEVVDVTGAGDALIAGTLCGLLEGRPLEAACALGLRLAAVTVSSRESVVSGVLRASLG